MIEFGQLLAGPYVGTLLGDFGADVVKIEAPPGGDAMRDWGRLRHNDHSLWWSILARNKRSVTLNLREAEGQRIAMRLCEARRRRARELPARHDGEVGPRPRGRPREQPARDLRARDRLRADRPLPRPPRLRVGERGDLRPARHQRLPGPGAAAHRASASATRSPPSPRSRASCSPCTRATRAARPARSSTRRSPTRASR